MPETETPADPSLVPAPSAPSEQEPSEERLLELVGAIATGYLNYYATDSDVEAAEWLRSRLPVLLAAERRSVVDELIVSFLDDTLSGSAIETVSLQKTQEHDGARTSWYDGGDLRIWINAPIGDPDEPGSLDGETFREAMIDVIRRDGTPAIVAELDAALSPAVSSSGSVEHG